MRGINYLINRITTYPASESNINKEIQTIDYLLKANGYQQLKARKLLHNKKHHTQREDNKQIKKKVGRLYICWQRNKAYN
jgi:hypothetical protein